LGDTGNSIILICEVLTNAVKMKASAVVGKTVLKRNFDGVSPISEESWAWERSIDQQNIP
jgi:hypothetical protein